MELPYRLIRSRRRTLSLEVNSDLQIVVRAPLHLPQAQIDAFVACKQDWLQGALQRQQQRRVLYPEPTPQQADALRRRAKEELPPLVRYYAAQMGLTPTGIKITGAKKRFGSCSGRDSLCFSYRLMQYPREAVEYVVVHELCHICHKNHGKEFYRLVSSVLPDYRRRAALLSHPQP